MNWAWIIQVHESGGRHEILVYVGQTTTKGGVPISGYHIHHLLHQISNIGQILAANTHDVFLVHHQYLENREDMMEMEAYIQEFVHLRFEAFRPLPDFTSINYKKAWTYQNRYYFFKHSTKTDEEMKTTRGLNYQLANTREVNLFCYDTQCYATSSPTPHIHPGTEGAIFHGRLHMDKEFVKIEIKKKPTPGPRNNAPAASNAGKVIHDQPFSIFHTLLYHFN